MWKETCPMDQKIHLVNDWLKKELSVTELSNIYGVSRKTIYKWIRRYSEQGPAALEEQSRMPLTNPRATPPEIVDRVIKTKLAHQKWGPKKVIALLRRYYPEDHWPVASTAGEILKREGLVKTRGRKHHTPPYMEPFNECEKPNDVWSLDYKGQFRMGDGKLCYPLTMTDNYSRFILVCRGLYHPTIEETRPWIEWAFRECGLPKAIKSDNGEPFASIGLGGLSRLSVWFIKLGIKPERIKTGHPEQNGRHERMHRTLKEMTITPPRDNMEQQQRVFDRFRREFNNEYPHEALGMNAPASFYIPSGRSYPERTLDVEYDGKYVVRHVKNNGQIKWKGRGIYVSETLIGEPVGLKQIGDYLWEVRFSFHLLGYLNESTGKIGNSPV
jgi:transposase InsO family protein